MILLYSQKMFRRQKTMENLEKRNRELEMARVKNKDIIQSEQRQQVKHIFSALDRLEILGNC